jgi:ribosomal protein S27E
MALQKDMDGVSRHNQDDVICAFCGRGLAEAGAIKLLLIAPSGETQTIFAHATHLLDCLQSSVPIHPDIFEAAARERESLGISRYDPTNKGNE